MNLVRRLLIGALAAVPFAHLFEHLMFMGSEHAEYPTFEGQVNAVTAADVQRVARQYIPADRATLVVVGDLAKVRAGIEALKLGTVTTLDVSSIAR